MDRLELADALAETMRVELGELALQQIVLGRELANLREERDELLSALTELCCWAVVPTRKDMVDKARQAFDVADRLIKQYRDADKGE